MALATKAEGCAVLTAEIVQPIPNVISERMNFLQDNNDE